MPLLVLPEDAELRGYRRLRFLGAGGMSTAYRANRQGRDYVLKEVPASESAQVIALTREKFTLDRLDHAGIVKARDLFEEDGFYYLVLDFVDGKTLEALASPFPDTFLQESVVLDWALQLCDIFEFLHDQAPPIIYRDLKPGNVMRDRNGRLHLIDFGIARWHRPEKSRDTEQMGSALTASPEHYGAAQTDARSDIFTLGATLHWLLCNGRGRSEEPFRFAPIRTLNSRVSIGLEQVLRKATEFDPGDRFQAIGEMRQALLACRTGSPSRIARPAGESAFNGHPTNGSRPPETPGPSRPPRRMTALLTLLLLVLLGGALAWVVSSPPSLRAGSGPARPPATASPLPAAASSRSGATVATAPGPSFSPLARSGAVRPSPPPAPAPSSSASPVATAPGPSFSPLARSGAVRPSPPPAPAPSSSASPVATAPGPSFSPPVRVADYPRVSRPAARTNPSPAARPTAAPPRQQSALPDSPGYRVSIPRGYRLAPSAPPAPETGLRAIHEYQTTAHTNRRILRIAERVWPGPVTPDQTVRDHVLKLESLGVQNVVFLPRRQGPGVEIHGRGRGLKGEETVIHELLLPGREPNTVYILSAECEQAHDAANAQEFARFFASFSLE